MSMIRQIWRTPGIDAGPDTDLNASKNNGIRGCFWGRREQIRFQLSASISVSRNMFLVLCGWKYGAGVPQATPRHMSCISVDLFSRILLLVPGGSAHNKGLLPETLISCWRCCAIVVNHWSLLLFQEMCYGRFTSRRAQKYCMATLECVGVTSDDRRKTIWIGTSCLGMILPFDTISDSSTEMTTPRCSWEVLLQHLDSALWAKTDCAQSRPRTQILEWHSKTDTSSRSKFKRSVTDELSETIWCWFSQVCSVVEKDRGLCTSGPSSWRLLLWSRCLWK